MQVVSCNEPSGQLEPAPLTCLPLLLEASEGRVSAFWSGDDDYFVRLDGEAEGKPGAPRWFQIDRTMPLPSPHDAESRLGAARQWLDVIPMGGGRVAFPVGSTGRTVYRVWRSKGGRASLERPAGRTRILGVRAGRSLRRPA
jgi:hypothetical protein